MDKKLDKDFIEDIIAEVKHDYQTRRYERRHFEAQWQLNSNFVSGNQYCAVSLAGGLVDCEKDYYWQEREVFNHIAFIVETRLAKLEKVRPKLSVRPSSGDEDDIKAAKVSTKILQSTYNKLGIDDILSKGANWSETCGSVFYKVSWDKNAGKKVGIIDGMPVYEGEVKIDICPPYEIFPDSLTHQDITDCNSIIHAKAVHVDDIFKIWGVVVQPEEVDTISLSSAGILGGLGLSSAVPKMAQGKASNCAVVIERYTKPSATKPNGELVIIAGDKLLYYGDLPFRCGADGEYALPFIKQDSIAVAGCFFGSSIVERAIPVQRAYNAVKNRKHEFLNRLAMGVLAVEDGSVDIENLETEGLSPGKILVYRQGSTPPKMLDAGSIPAELAQEEEKLLNEFIMISGVSEVMRSSSVPTSVSSGAAIQLLLEQDDTRLSTTAQRIRVAAKKMSQFILRLYKQFATLPRLSRCVGSEGEIELVYWKGSDLSSDDVIFDTENELSDSAANRRNMLFELLKSGLLHDENGKLSDAMRYKVLEVLGYGSWEYARDTQRLQAMRAARENNMALSTPPKVREIDDHSLHIAEHTKFMLSTDFEKLASLHKDLENIMNEHIRQHKELLKNQELERLALKDNPTLALTKEKPMAEEKQKKEEVKDGRN